MRLQYLDDRINSVEGQPELATITDALDALRNALSLDDFGIVMIDMPDTHYPRLSEILPQMASPEVQKNWTGSSGITLLRQSIDFVRMLSNRYQIENGRAMSNATILDYGCGYGRLLRLMLYFTDPGKLYGCDPWDRSIALCKEAGIGVDLQQTEYLPNTLPYADNSFDLVYAFSVFTHTSLRATQQAFAAIRPKLQADGLFAVTIRPVEYWSFDQGLSAEESDALIAEHDKTGFAFRPHQRAPIDGDITYGDTTMNIKTLTELCPGWKTVGYDRSVNDPYQIVVYLRKA